MIKKPTQKYYCPYCLHEDILREIRKHIKEAHNETAAPESSKFWQLYKVQK